MLKCFVCCGICKGIMVTSLPTMIIAIKMWSDFSWHSEVKYCQIFCDIPITPFQIWIHAMIFLLVLVMFQEFSIANMVNRIMKCLSKAVPQCLFPHYSCRALCCGAKSSFLDRDIWFSNFWHHNWLDQGSMWGKYIPVKQPYPYPTYCPEH